MLKTSSTKSVEPKKGVVEIGGGGRNKAELVGKHEVDGVDVGGKSVEKSRSQKIVKKSTKLSKTWKVAKVIGLEKCLPKHQSSVD